MLISNADRQERKSSIRTLLFELGHNHAAESSAERNQRGGPMGMTEVESLLHVLSVGDGAATKRRSVATYTMTQTREEPPIQTH